MKQEFLAKTLPLCVGVFVLSIIISYAVLAWTEPSTIPPGGDVAAPINTGSVTQTKTGGLNIAGNVGIGTTNPSQKLEVNGNINAAAFYYTSDASLKKDIMPIDEGLKKIEKLNGVYFRWKSSGEPSMGLIAQDVEKIFPEAVTTNSETGLKSVDYGKLVAPLIETAKEQQKEIEDLKAQIKELKIEINH